MEETLTEHLGKVEANTALRNYLFLEYLYITICMSRVISIEYIYVNFFVDHFAYCLGHRM